MILSDFLSRQIEDDSNLHEIIPISFNRWEILQDSYHQLTTDTYNVHTRAQVKAQANTPTVPDTQAKKQKITPEVTGLPIQTGKRNRELKHCPVESPNKPQEALYCPQSSYYPQLL